MGPAEAIRRGVVALGAGRFDEAASAFSVAWADPDLAAAEDMDDIRARVASLYAQALLEAGRPAEADRPCREAIRLLRRQRDREGLAEVRALQDRIVRALAHDAEAAERLAEQRRVAAEPLEVLLASASSASERAAVFVRKANALLDTGAPGGDALAREGLALALEAGDVTWQVMARVALARALPDDAATQLALARDAADAAEEFNLISTIARAAQVAGVRLEAHAGPHPEDSDRCR